MATVAGEIAEHSVFGRAIPIAAEILQGRELTWQFIIGCLMHGSPSNAIPEQEVSSRGLLDTSSRPGNCRYCWVQMAYLK